LQKIKIQYILNFSMIQTRFVKSFSKGQITIPKTIRKAIGIKDDFWLKLSVDSGKIVAEPVEPEIENKDYAKRLLTVKGSWFSQTDFGQTRSEVEKKLKKLHGQNSS